MISAGNNVSISAEHDIIFGVPYAELIRLTEVFSQQLAIGYEALNKEQTRAAELAIQLGFTREAVIGFFRILGEQDVPLEAVPVKLVEIATRHRDLLDKWSVLDVTDPRNAELADDARQAIETGRYDEADGLLLQASENEIALARQAEQLAQQANEVAKRRLIQAAESRKKRGDLAMTRLRYGDAMENYEVAASLLPPNNLRKGELLLLHGESLWRLSEKTPSSPMLTKAILFHDTHTQSLDTFYARRDWGEARRYLGKALRAVGFSEVQNTANLHAAVRVYDQALTALSRDAYPLEWAEIQVDRGTALITLGDRTREFFYFKKAIECLAKALEVKTRNQFPLEWAVTKERIGTALASGVDCGGCEADLSIAETTFREALNERSLENAPELLVRTQVNLAVTLRRLGERQGQLAKLFESENFLKTALKLTPRQRNSHSWADIKTNLSQTIGTISSIKQYQGATSRTVVRYLKEALTQQSQALEECAPNRDLRQWIQARGNLAVLLKRLGQTSKNSDFLMQAGTILSESLSVIPIENIPMRLHPSLALASVCLEIGENFYKSGDFSAAITAVNKAEKAYNELSVGTDPVADPAFWASQMNGLGLVFLLRGLLAAKQPNMQSATELLSRALQNFEAALTVSSSQLWPIEFKRITINLHRARKALMDIAVDANSS